MKKIISLFLTILFICCLTSCDNSKLKKFTDYSFDYFDTVTTIVGFEESQGDFDNNCKKIKNWLSEYHKLYDIYTRYDNLNNLCTINSSTEPVKVDTRIIDMLLYAKKMYKLTDGKINIAMGSVLSIWHDYREDGLNNPSTAQLPPISALKEANKHTDFNNIVINRENSTVQLTDPKTSLDVGAIAKGYATQEIAKLMKEQNITGYILNVGGNVCIVGEKADGEKWKVGIENPDTENKDKPYIEYLSLSEMSLVTSGSYQRYYTVDGKNHHHIIDPVTLMPADNFKSVSVLCQDSALADSLSTALFCMSFEDGKKLVESIPNTHAMWVLKDGKQLYSKNFKKYCE